MASCRSIGPAVASGRRGEIALVTPVHISALYQRSAVGPYEEEKGVNVTAVVEGRVSGRERGEQTPARVTSITAAAERFAL